jgi:RNA polymerase sigma factor (sigma-70 family)
MNKKTTTIPYTLANGQSVNVKVSITIQAALEKFERLNQSMERKERRYGVDLYPNDCMDAFAVVQQRDPADVLIDADARENLRQAMVLLSPQQRRRLCQYAVEGLAYQQIAEIEKVNRTTVLRSIRKALQILQKNLAE